MAKDEDYNVKLAIGTVVMNRIDSAWFPNDLEGVLSEQQQFPCGELYDSDSLAAAHAVISGERALEYDAVYIRALDASEQCSDEYVIDIIGNYAFYSQLEYI